MEFPNLSPITVNCAMRKASNEIVTPDWNKELLAYAQQNQRLSFTSYPAVLQAACDLAGREMPDVVFECPGPELSMSQ
jgi:hypothetical protein